MSQGFTRGQAVAYTLIALVLFSFVAGTMAVGSAAAAPSDYADGCGTEEDHESISQYRACLEENVTPDQVLRLIEEEPGDATIHEVDRVTAFYPERASELNQTAEKRVAEWMTAAVSGVQLPSDQTPSETPTATPTGTATSTPTSTATPSQTTSTATTATPVGEQSASTSNETRETREILYELEDADIRDVEFINGTVVVDVYYHSYATVSITDSGAVKGLGSNSGTGVQFNRYTHDEGEYTLKLQLRSDDELVTIQQGDRMYAASGDRAVIDIIRTAPTIALLRWSAVSGGIGAILALGLSVGIRKRKHENTYKELTTGERTKVEQDPVEGVLGKVTRFVSHHRYALLTAAGIVAYLTLVVAGVAPPPGEIWDGMTDSQRVVFVGSIAMLILSFVPVYVISGRLWEPAKEFVFDVDARDLLDEAVGARGGLAELQDIDNPEDAENAADALEDEDITVAAVYSGSPERISQMRVDGELADGRAAGGPGYFVQDFDPKRNRAEGVWPGLANDFELAKERSKIDANREILEDWATVGRRVISAIPAIRAGSDTAAVASVDRKFGENATVNPDPVDDIMDSAVSGTRFERFYRKDDEDDEDDEEYDDEDEAVNDDGDGGGEGDE